MFAVGGRRAIEEWCGSGETSDETLNTIHLVS